MFFLCCCSNFSALWTKVLPSVEQRREMLSSYWLKNTENSWTSCVRSRYKLLLILATETCSLAILYMLPTQTSLVFSLLHFYRAVYHNRALFYSLNVWNGLNIDRNKLILWCFCMVCLSNYLLHCWWKRYALLFTSTSVNKRLLFLGKYN